MTGRAGQRLVLALAFVLGLVLARVAPADGQDDPLGAASARVMQSIDAGRLFDVTDALASGFDTLPPADREAWFFFAAHTCISLGSLACAAVVLNQPMVRDFAPDRTYPQTGGALILLLSWFNAANGDDSGARKLAEQGIPPGLATPLSNPVLFAELALLAAQQARRANNFALSRGYLDRALAATLSIPVERHEATSLVLRIIRQHVANYDVERALRLFAAAEALFDALPRASLSYVEVVTLRAELHGYLHDLPAATRDLTVLLGLLGGLQVEPEVRERRRADAYTQLITIEMLQGHDDLATGLLRHHPMAPRRAEIRARGRFANADEFWFAVMEELIHGEGARVGTASGAEGWRALLEQPVGWTTHDDDREQAEAFARGAAGLNRLRRGDGAAKSTLVEAARRRLATLHRLHRQSIFASPLPSWPDRLLLQVAATATLSSATPDIGLLLGTHLVLSRTLQSRADDTLAALARYRTDAGRSAVQGLYTTDLQRIDWETAQLEALARRLADRPVRPPAAERAAIIAEADSFTRRQRALRAALVTPPGGHPDGYLLGVRALQHQLQADEALLLYVTLLDGNLGKLCLRRDRALARFQSLEVADGAHADRLMESLLSDAPPSPRESFPVEAAVRLDRVLLGDLAPCLAGARRVHYVPPTGLRRFPPAALIAEPPPTVDGAPDLRAARWRVRDHAFVHTTSISAFLASRRLVGRRTADLDYLGIGDPVLRGPVLGSTLPELPEASQELQAAAGLFPAERTRLLIRAEATEPRLREAPASAYDILHFATHGLTRHDLPDLEEPGLVLSAGPAGDGFLAASRIATLPLHARLVVLSACNSARDDALLTDRGIQGLATAFTLAGVPTMIAALWPVDSAMARDTIVATFQTARAAPGVGIADALAEAIRRHLDGPTPRPLLHPRFWAALVVLGDGAMRLPAPMQSP